MFLARMCTLIAAAVALAGCANQVSSVSVFEPTAVQPPPSERGAGLGKRAGEPASAPPAAEDRSTRRALSVPSR